MTTNMFLVLLLILVWYCIRRERALDRQADCWDACRISPKPAVCRKRCKLPLLYR